MIATTTVVRTTENKKDRTVDLQDRVALSFSMKNCCLYREPGGQKKGAQ